MIPWYAWIYVAVLGLVGTAEFHVARRGGVPLRRAVLQLSAVVVLALGVGFFYYGRGAGFVYMLALLAAVLVLARKSTAMARAAHANAPPPAVRLGSALGGLAMLPAIALGALAVWIQQGA